MNNPLIQHRCTCGYHLLSNPDAEKKWTLTHKGFARIFHPCSKCLKSQEMIEEIIERLEEVKATPGQKFYDGLNAAVEIIKEGGGLE